MTKATPEQIKNLIENLTSPTKLSRNTVDQILESANTFCELLKCKSLEDDFVEDYIKELDSENKQQFSAGM